MADAERIKAMMNCRHSRMGSSWLPPLGLLCSIRCEHPIRSRRGTRPCRILLHGNCACREEWPVAMQTGTERQ